VAIGLVVGCTKRTSISPQEAESRLSHVISETAKNAGLEAIDREARWSLCEDTATQALSITILVTNAEEDTGRYDLRAVHAYWSTSASELLEGSKYDLIDRSLNAPGAPRIYLEFDGYSISANYDAELRRFRLGGSAPCVRK
jgi:hypothetical protein